MSRTTRTISCTVLVALATAPVLGVATPAVAATAASTASAPADAGRQPASEDFTAGVRSIDHFLGVVTLVGTAPVGTSVELAGDVVEPVSTEADGSGRWTGQVGVRHGQHSIRVTSMVSGQVVHVPVEVLILQDPWMAAQVNGYARTIQLDLTGHPHARLDVSLDGTLVGQVDTDDDGKASLLLRDVAFGTRHVAVEQYFDGTRNGADAGDFTVSGAPVVTASSASRETERIHLDGRAPAGATVGFAIGGVPVLGADGTRITVTTSDDTTWTAALPIPADAARAATVTVTASDGDDELGAVDTDVVIPAALTASVTQLDDGRVRFSGDGEPGATVTLESTDGDPLTDAAGATLETTIDDGWELAVPRDALPDVLVARQRVSGVDQGGVRLVLPALPVRPAPDSGAGVSTGNHAPGQRPAAAKLTSAPTTGRLAYTGAEPAGALGAAALLLLAGAGTAAVARRLRRRGTHRAAVRAARSA